MNNIDEFTDLNCEKDHENLSNAFQGEDTL